MFSTFYKYTIRFALSICCLIGLYILSALTLPHIKINKDFKNKLEGIKIYVISNGVHTDLVVPAKTIYKDWTLTFPLDSFDVKDDTRSFIGFGWGDKEFFLNTANWSDLKASTALKAAIGMNETAMHVHYMKEMKKESAQCISLSIDTISYTKLLSYIENSFIKKEGSFLKIQHPGYGQYDRFYEATGSYSLFKTCNIWTNNALKEINAQTAIWSPLAGPLMHSLKH